MFERGGVDAGETPALRLLLGHFRHPTTCGSTRSSGGLLGLGVHAHQLVVWAGDDVDADDGPNPPGCLRACIDGGLYGGDVALDERSHHAAAGLVPADHLD